MKKDYIITIILIIILIITLSSSLTNLQGPYVMEHVDKIPPKNFLKLAIEAYNWMMQFQVTPPDYKWGWHTPCREAWGGLAGYYTRGFKWAASYRLTSLNQVYIASHDVGWFMELGVMLYQITGNKTFLRAAELAAEWALRIQVGYSEWLKEFENKTYYSITEVNGKITWSIRRGIHFPKEVRGAFTEGIFFLSGKPPYLGKWGTESNFAEPALWIAPEHTIPLARGLLRLYQVTGNKTYLEAVLRAINFLIYMQSPEGGIYTCYPKEAYGIRMGDTADAALLFFQVYEVTGNKTILQHGLKACNFMLEKQCESWIAYGGLPYLSTAGGTWRRNSYFVGDAAAAIEAWLEAYSITHNKTYFEAALKAAEFVLSLQETPPGFSWGVHLFSNDIKAIGGFYWCYYDRSRRIITYEFTADTASVAYALLKLYEYTHTKIYLGAVSLAYTWLTKTDIRKPSNERCHLPGLVIISDPHGLYKSGYIPSLGKYYDEVYGTMTGDPREGFCVAMSATAPCYLYLELYKVFKRD